MFSSMTSKFSRNNQKRFTKVSLLYYNDELWVKMGEINFDVTMGAYNRAEVCGLIGSFMLSLLSKHNNKNHVGLYKDDSPSILQNTSGLEGLSKIF